MKRSEGRLFFPHLPPHWSSACHPQQQQRCENLQWCQLSAVQCGNQRHTEPWTNGRQHVFIFLGEGAVVRFPQMQMDHITAAAIGTHGATGGTSLLMTETTPCTSPPLKMGMPGLLAVDPGSSPSGFFFRGGGTRCFAPRCQCWGNCHGVWDRKATHPGQLGQLPSWESSPTYAPMVSWITSENHTSPHGSDSVLDFSNVDEISGVCHMTSQTSTKNMSQMCHRSWKALAYHTLVESPVEGCRQIWSLMRRDELVPLLNSQSDVSFFLCKTGVVPIFVPILLQGLCISIWVCLKIVYP